MKSYTDLEQSKKLAEILPLESADMCWTNHCYGAIRSSMTISAKTVDEYKSLLDRFNGSASIDVFYPAWSLAALLNLCPTINRKQPILTRGKLTRLWYCYYEDEIDTQTYDNPIDACYEMICWLKENGKL